MPTGNYRKQSSIRPPICYRCCKPTYTQTDHRIIIIAMTLSEIWVYPVKSLGGIRLDKALTEERGLQYDRRWMIVDDKNVFITQRAHYKMALIDVALEAEGLKIFL